MHERFGMGLSWWRLVCKHRSFK